MPDGPKYKRVLLKISGEGFCPEGGFGIEGEELEEIARECVEVCQTGVQLAVVVGGGNFIRGATFSEEGNIPRATADYMGMLATVLNAVALQETMEKMGQPTRVMTAITLAMERKLPLVVFNLKTPGNIARVIRGENVGTKITP